VILSLAAAGCSASQGPSANHGSSAAHGPSANQGPAANQGSSATGGASGADPDAGSTDGVFGADATNAGDGISASGADLSKVDIEELARMLPYVGMPAEYVDMTICGPHTRESKNFAYCYDGACAYEWLVDGELVMRVECTAPEGEVAVVSKYRQLLYWDEDGFPHMTDRTDPSTWCVSPEGLLAQWEAFEAKRDKTVDQYATAEAYADDYWYDFAEEVAQNLGGFDYSEDWDYCCEMGYLEACEWWYENQPRPKPEI